jgi:ribosomal protein L40E
MFGMGAGAAIVVVMGALLTYFIPGIIGEARHHRNATGIFVLNLLLGWTVLGWIAALAWACSSFEPKPRSGDSVRAADRKLCKHCGTDVSIDATTCRRCGKDPGEISRKATLTETLFGKKDVCAHCGTLLPGDAKVCINCGRAPGFTPQPVSRAGHEPTTAARYFCAQCGGAQTESESFCVRCGTKFA